MVTDVGGIPMVQTGYGGDGFGSNGIWAILLLALLGGRGFGGFGGYAYGGGEAVATVDNSVWTAQNFSRLENGQNAISGQLSAIGQGICSATFDLNNSVKDGTYATTSAINEAKYQLGNGICNSTFGITTAIGNLGTQLQNCCCGIERSIDGVNFNGERNTNAIVQANNANTQRILDFLTCNELKEAQAKIFEQGQLLSEARIIAAMKPQAPIPAYNVPSPYAAYGMCGC